MDLLDLINSGEGQQIEFKASFSGENEAIESLCAFSNSEGGTVLIGISDSGEVVGANLGKNTLENFANKLHSSSDPTLYVSINSQELDTKVVVSISVKPPRPGELFYVFGRPLIRVGKTNQVMSVSEQRERLLAGQENKGRPEVVVGFQYDGGLVDHMVININEVPIKPDYDKEIQNRRSGFLEKYKEDQENRSQNLVLRMAFDQNSNYLDEVETYLSRYHRFLEELYEYRLTADRLKEIFIATQNRAGNHAEDVTIELTFPSPLSIPSKERLFITEFEEPSPPKEPVLHRSWLDILGSPRDYLTNIPNSSIPSGILSDVHGPSYEVCDDSFMASYKVRRLVPDLLERDFEPVQVWLGGINTDVAIPIVVKVYAANLPIPEVHELTLEIRMNSD